MKGTRERIERDLQRSPARRVLYVEGRDELVMLPALLGRTPGQEFVDGVLLADASGGDQVEGLVADATAAGLPGVFGAVDGDGRRAADLQRGPLFVWPAYDLEAVLIRAAWPAQLGAPPDWREVTSAFVGTVALNRLSTRSAISELSGLQHRPLTRAEGRAALERWWGRVSAQAPFDEFSSTADAFEAMDPDARLRWLSGKRSLLNRVGERLGADESARRLAWAEAASAAGGAPELRAWWDRCLRPPRTT